jgi:hypothetical protein
VGLVLYLRTWYSVGIFSFASVHVILSFRLKLGQPGSRKYQKVIPPVVLGGLVVRCLPLVQGL